MKLPKTFLPDKDLENKVGDLKSQKKSKVKSLNDLVLWRDSEDFIYCTKIDDSDFKEDCSYVDVKAVYEKYSVKYDDVILLILEFIDKSSLEDNKKSIKKCLGNFNDKHMYSHLSAVFKDKYVVFIETFLGDCTNRSKFIDSYKKEFGFREFK